MKNPAKLPVLRNKSHIGPIGCFRQRVQVPHSLLVASATALLALAAVLPVQADYSNTVMSLNPVAYWQLNEQSPLPATVTNYGSLGAVANGSDYGWGTTWDTSPHAVPGALEGSPDTATIFYDYAIGVGRILIPWNATINPDPPQPFTVECWANPYRH